MPDPNIAIWQRIDALNQAHLRDHEPPRSALLTAIGHELASLNPADYRTIGEITHFADGVTLSTLFRSEVTVVLAAYLDPGAMLPLHDHVGFCGVMRVIEGSVLVDNYEPLDHRRQADVGPTHVRKVHSRRYDCGATATILAGESDVHEVRPGSSGGVFIDVYTLNENPGSCRFYAFDGPPDELGTRAVRTLFDAPIH